MARSVRSRYGHAFSRGRTAGAARADGPVYGAKRFLPEFARAPQPDRRHPARVDPELAQMRVWEVIENDVRIKIACDNCHHEAVWTRAFMEKRLRRRTGLTVLALAMKLRCAGCRSEYVRIWRA